MTPERTFTQLKVEPDWTAGTLACGGWWVATPGDLGDLIVVKDLGPSPRQGYPDARLYEERGSHKQVVLTNTPDGYLAVAFPHEAKEHTT